MRHDNLENTVSSKKTNSIRTQLGHLQMHRFYPNVTTLPSGICYRKSVYLLSVMSSKRSCALYSPG